MCKSRPRSNSNLTLCISHLISKIKDGIQKMFIRARLSVVFCVQDTPRSLGGMAERSMTVLKNSLIDFFFLLSQKKKKN